MRVSLGIIVLLALVVVVGLVHSTGRVGPAQSDTPAALPTAAAGKPPRLVLLYAPCTVTTAHLGAYNPAVPYTPSLTAFARESVVFQRHQGEAGRSAIDYAALFTGNQAMRHRVFANQDRLPDEMYTLAEAFRDGGYDTFFWAGHPFASPALQFAQGVEKNHLFDGNEGMGYRHYNERGFLHAEDAAFQTILDELSRNPDYRAFVMTNFSVTHGPYSTAHRALFCAAYPAECAGLTTEDFVRYAQVWMDHSGTLSLFPSSFPVLGLSPEEFATMTRVVELLYKSTLFYLDSLFGSVVETIRDHGLFDDAAIVFTADHGEVLYRKNARFQWSHGFQLAPEELHIPLLIHAPGLAAGVYEPVSRSVDVLPTLAALAQIALPPANEMMGVDLLPALRGEQPPPALRAFSHTTLNQRVGTALPDPDIMLVGVREGDRFYRREPWEKGKFRHAVYDWRADPTEHKTLYTPADADMFRHLDEYKQALVRTFRGEAKGQRRPVLSEAQREQLRQLGYAE